MAVKDDEVKSLDEVVADVESQIRTMATTSPGWPFLLEQADRLRVALHKLHEARKRLPTRRTIPSHDRCDAILPYLATGHCMGVAYPIGGADGAHHEAGYAVEDGTGDYVDEINGRSDARGLPPRCAVFAHFRKLGAVRFTDSEGRPIQEETSQHGREVLDELPEPGVVTCYRVADSDHAMTLLAMGRAVVAHFKSGGRVFAYRDRKSMWRGIRTANTRIDDVSGGRDSLDALRTWLRTACRPQVLD